MWSARQFGLLGYAVIGIGLGGTGLWAANAEIASAVMAPGVVTPESSRKVISHLEGGIVDEVFVRDGDAVEAGQLLVSLSPIQAGASLEMLVGNEAYLRALESRLVAEMRGTAPEFPSSVAGTEFAADQRALFENRKRFVAQQKSVLDAKISSLQSQLTGWTERRDALQESMASLKSQLVGAAELETKKLKPRTEVDELRRRVLSVTADIAEAKAEMGSAASGLAEANLQKEIVEHQIRQEASAQLTETRDRIAEVGERIRMAQDTARRTEIRAPQAGTVQGLTVHARGAVVQPAAPLLELVPLGGSVVIEAQVLSSEIDRIHAGQQTEVKFPSFNAVTTPRISGKVTAMSGDAVPDAEGRRFAHKILITLDDDTVPVDVRERLMPGMPATVIAATEARTVLSYLLRPLMDALGTALRER